MDIRSATITDAEGIASVHVRAWQSAYRGIVPDSYLERLSVENRMLLWRNSLECGKPEVWVAFEGMDIVGWVAFGASRDDGALPRVGEVEAIYVDPKHWSTGVGRALWLKARSRLVDRGFSAVTLWVLQQNDRAIRFYRSAGFIPEPASEKTRHRDGQDLIEIRYKAVLP